ncbi:hypothetical protein [Kitasatospora sp. NBC_01266]|uniref:hypothetical protein n=1 Tax=Kitasatospora sp. NBC_01266 TaxID=2903572 RepID=UPI002E335532|nr:hypothetical protein [Kitasatospora sp. NBC_01266]
MPKTTAEKLGIKPGATLTLINTPDGQAAPLGPLPDGVTLESGSGGTADVVVLFAHDSGELHRHAPAAFAAVAESGKVWIAYRKGGVSDLSRDTLMPALTELGWHGVSLVSVDTTWSAARFRPLHLIGHCT